MIIIPPTRNPWVDLSRDIGQGMFQTAQLQNQRQQQEMANFMQGMKLKAMLESMEEQKRQRELAQQPSPLGFITKVTKTVPTLPQGVTGMESYVPPPEMKTSTETTHMPMNWEQIKQLGPSVTELIKEGFVGPAGATPKTQVKNYTPEMLIAGQLQEELGREPTFTEIKARQQREAKGYDTEDEAFEVSKRMVQRAGPDAALLPGVELSPQNKWVPKPQPDIGKRIPPFSAMPGIPFINLNRKTGAYTDPFTRQDLTRDEAISKYGEGATLNADKMALGELTKREQLIKIFTTRIDANVPIVLDAIRDIENTNPRLLNQGINAARQFFMGSGKWQALQTAVQSLSNEIQRVESNSLGIGGQGQEERKMWAKIHDPNMSLADWKTMSKMILRLSKTAAGAVETQRGDLIKRITGETGEGQTSTPTKTKVRSGIVQSGSNKGKRVTEWSDGSRTYE